MARSPFDGRSDARLTVLDGKGNQIFFGIIRQSSMTMSPRGNDDIEIIVDNGYQMCYHRHVDETASMALAMKAYGERDFTITNNFMEQAKRAGKMALFASLYGASDATLASLLQWRQTRGPVKNLEIGFLGKFDEITPRGAHRVNYVFDLGDQW